MNGDKRRAILANPFCTADRLEAWLAYWTREGCTAKGERFRSKWRALNYAVTCCLNGDEPPPSTTLRFAQDASSTVAEDAAAGAAAGPLPADDDDGEDEVDPLPVFDPSLSLFEHPGRLWQAVCGELQLQMTHATYSTWVKPTAAVKFVDGCMTVAVPNQYSKDWWDQRLKTTAVRVLSGIANAQCRVEFVVWRMRR